MSESKTCNHPTINTNDMQKMCISIVPIFNHLAHDEMAEIVKTTQSITFKRGESLYNAGDPFNSLYIIHKGKVKIYRLSESGKEQIIRILEPGDFTGEHALFSESVHESYAEAMEKTEICMMSRDALQNYLLRYPQISLKILSEFSKRLDRVEILATSFATEDVDTRVALYLAEQTEQSKSMNITLPMSRKNLASYLGTTPETISRKLTSFEEAGWIEQMGQKKLRILDLDALLLI